LLAGPALTTQLVHRVRFNTRSLPLFTARVTAACHLPAAMESAGEPVQLNVEQHAGCEAALRELEHQAVHLEIDGQPDAAEILFTAVEIARAGGLRCEHRLSIPD